MDRFRNSPPSQKLQARPPAFPGIGSHRFQQQQHQQQQQQQSYAPPQQQAQNQKHPLFGMNRQPLFQLPTSAFMHNKQQQQLQQQQQQHQHQPSQPSNGLRSISSSQPIQQSFHVQSQQSYNHQQSMSRRDQQYVNVPRSVGPYTEIATAPTATPTSQSIEQKPRSLVQQLLLRNQPRNLDIYYDENENYNNMWEANDNDNTVTGNNDFQKENSKLLPARLATSFSAPASSAAQEAANMKLTAALHSQKTSSTSNLINNSNSQNPSTSNSTNSNSNSNSIRSLLTTSSAELQKQLFMPKYASSSSLQSVPGASAAQSVFNFLSNPGTTSKSSQEILQELELKQFRMQRAQEKAKQSLQSTKDQQHQQLAESIKLLSNRFPLDNITNTAHNNLNRRVGEKQSSHSLGSRASSTNTRSDSDSSDVDFSEEAMKKQRRLNEDNEKRIQLKKSLKGVKEFFESAGGERMKKAKLLAKEEEKTARVRQELIEAAQAQERERIETERRAQREKLVQIKRAEELRKRKRVIAAAATAATTAVTTPITLTTTTTLEYRNRMREELKNINLDEQLIANPIDAATDTSNTVLSIAPNNKRGLSTDMDFEFLAGCESDETTDSANYFALLRFVFSQDFNRPDILRIENKRIPNKFSNWKEYFSIFEYLFLMECVANIQQGFTSFKSHENYRQPLGCYVKPVSSKENAHGFLELQVCRRGADLDDGEVSSAMEDDYYTLMSMRNHAVLISSTSDMQLSTLSQKVTGSNDPFLFFGWVVPPDKADPKSVLKVYIDIESSSFAAIFEENPLLYVTIFNFTKMTTFIREYLAIKNMRECGLNRFIYNPSHIIETKTAISNPQVLVPLFDELHSKYNESQFQSIKEICLTEQGICMLQGPPGTGKTHTLLGLLSGLYLYIKKNPDTTKPKIMICAPSNTAVDEIVSRIVEHGLHQPGGLRQRINVVRMGAIDYVPQENVKRASLEYQIETMMRQKGIQATTSKGQAIEQETLIDMRINVARVNQEIEKAKKELVGSELKDLMNSLYAKKRAMKAKIAVQKLEKVARRDQIKQISDQILGLADVVCCTLSSSMSEKLERFKNQIEVLIVDEAAQCSEPNNIIPLFYQPNKMVLIGDPKQLPATTFQPDSNVTKYNRSLFERIIDNSINPYFLDQQYRMHPDIRAFPSTAFYDNKLKDGQLVLSREFPASVAKMEKHNVQFIDITFSREKFSNKSYENDAEGEAAISICNAVFAQQQANSIAESPSIGIITPYKQQTKLINDMIRRNVDKTFWKHIQVNTVDSFQGQEKDIIIFTTVRATHSKDRFRQRMIGFLQDERRMNVALTRARYCLFVLGHADTLNSNPTWGNYVDSMAAIKRYGKLTRRDNLRDIGEYVIQGTLIDSEKPSSIYVKKDWGEEYRLAQLQKEQVNELKLDDFETTAAEPSQSTAESATLQSNGADDAVQKATSDNDENNGNTSDQNRNNTEMDLEEQAGASNEHDENQDQDQQQQHQQFDENGGDATPPQRNSPKRSGVSMQEAIEREEEEKAMREFGSGLQGLKSLLNPKQVRSARNFRLPNALATSANSSIEGKDDENGSNNETLNTSMEEEFSVNLDSAESHSMLKGLITDSSKQNSNNANAAHCANANNNSSKHHSSNASSNTFLQSSSSAFRLSSAAAIAKSTNPAIVALAQPPPPPTKKQLLMKIIFASEADRKNASEQGENDGKALASSNDNAPVDIYDQMRQQKQMNLKAKKAQLGGSYKSEIDHLKSQSSTSNSSHSTSSKSITLHKIDPSKQKQSSSTSSASASSLSALTLQSSNQTSTVALGSLSDLLIGESKIKATCMTPASVFARPTTNSIYDNLSKQRSLSTNSATTSLSTNVNGNSNMMTTTITTTNNNKTSTVFTHPTTCVTTIHSSQRHAAPATASQGSSSNSATSHYSSNQSRNGLVEHPSSYILKPASSIVTKPATGILCASSILHPQQSQAAAAAAAAAAAQKGSAVIAKSSSTSLLGCLFLKK